MEYIDVSNMLVDYYTESEIILCNVNVDFQEENASFIVYANLICDYLVPNVKASKIFSMFKVHSSVYFHYKIFELTPAGKKEFAKMQKKIRERVGKKQWDATK